MIFILCYVLFVNGARNCDGNIQEKKHTAVYDLYKNNFNKLYLSETFGGDLGIDVCEKYSREKYIRLLNSKGIKCRGDWCDSNGQFSCKESSNECYHGEHIIDMSNSDTGYDNNIFGNVIMAYGKWNQQVGQLCLDNVKSEKREIYGAIYDKAMENIIKCNKACGINNNTNPEDFDFFEYDVKLWIVILSSVLILMVLIFAFICLRYFNKIGCFKKQVYIPANKYTDDYVDINSDSDM